MLLERWVGIVSGEPRVPFLDHRPVGLAVAMQNLHQSKAKVVPRQALSGVLPRTVLRRRSGWRFGAMYYCESWVRASRPRSEVLIRHREHRADRFVEPAVLEPMLRRDDATRRRLLVLNRGIPRPGLS